MALTWPVKDPDEVLDYLLRWGARLAGDTIATHTVTVTSGAVEVDTSSVVADEPDANDETDYGADSAVQVWLSGGVVDTTCRVLVRITTAGGRTMDQTVKLMIRAK